VVAQNHWTEPDAPGQTQWVFEEVKRVSSAS
jgi:hypothetical protein